MSVFTDIKEKGQSTVSGLVDVGKDQPDDIKTWGVAAAAGLAGALGIAAVAKGVLAIVATIANPFVAVPVGAVGGGALGWSYMQSRSKDVEQSPQANSDQNKVYVAGASEDRIINSTSVEQNSQANLGKDRIYVAGASDDIIIDPV